MAKRRSFIDRISLAPVFALMFGTAVAIVIAAMPAWRFEAMIGGSGLGSVLAVAQPPLGMKARLLAVALGFALVALLVWGGVTLVQRLIAGPKPGVADNDFDDELDLSGYAENVPPVDAPRRPIFADKELGAPFMSDAALASAAAAASPIVLTPPEPVEAVVDLPDAPVDVAADAITDEMAPDDLVVPATDVLDVPLDVAEFDLPAAPATLEALPGESSIDTLIRRLEAGLARRAGPPPSGPPSPGVVPVAANPVGVMRDILAMNRETGGDDDDGTSRALDTLQAMAARRMVG